MKRETSSAAPRPFIHLSKQLPLQPDTTALDGSDSKVSRQQQRRVVLHSCKSSVSRRATEQPEHCDIMQSSIDYAKLAGFNEAYESGEAQNEVADRITAVLVPPPRPKPGIPTKTTKAFELAHAGLGRPKSRFSIAHRASASKPSSAPWWRGTDPVTAHDDRRVHDVRAHAIKQRLSGAGGRADSDEVDDLVSHRDANIASVRALMKKYPFQRSRADNKRLHLLLRELWPSETIVLDGADDDKYSVLRDLASVVTLDTYGAGLTVFGNTGLHMILRGSVKPQTLPYIQGSTTQESDDDDNDKEDGDASAEDGPLSPTPMLRRKHIKLGPGSWFGTLVKIEGRELNSKVLTCVTSEPCDFLKISVADYRRILERIRLRIEDEKVAVVKASPQYDFWPGLSLRKLAALITWKTVPANTVIVSEGEIAPFVAFIRRGKCDFYRHVTAVRTLPNGVRREVQRGVVMGSLGAGDSFGEFSITHQRAIESSVVAVDACVELGVIMPDRLDRLDATTRALFAQSARSQFADVTEADVHAKFIKQEMDGEWGRLKRHILLKTINYCGIRPGCGKWAKSQAQSANLGV